jgi:flagellar basal-body rod protein FlgG
MLRAIDLSRTAMLRHQQSLDVTAHNIANAQTAGFKAARAALEGGEAPSVSAALTPGGSSPTPALPSVLPVSRLFSQGDVRDTGQPTDMAIVGEGFFVVRQPDGTEGYTRNGAFRPDAEGRLVDGAGRPLEPPVTVPEGATGLRVARDGAVTAMVGGESREIGRVQLARFANPQGLLAGADGAFTATTASGAAVLGAPGEGGLGRIEGGALESATSDLTEQMTTMIAAQRAYQLNTSAFRMADEMLRIAGQVGNG